MRKSNLIVEFQKKFELSDVKWNKFLSVVEEGIPLKDICEKYNIGINVTSFKNNTNIFSYIFNCHTIDTRKL